MKPQSVKPFLTAINNASVTAVNEVIGVFNELTLAEGEKEKRYLYCRYGTYPQTVPGVGVIQQVVDREAAEQIVANFRQAAGMEVLFKGVPHYEGHPDDPAWLAQNPGHKAIAVGRIKKVEAGEDAIYVTSIFNTLGVPLLSGAAPAYDGHSPRWRMSPIPGKPKHFRPVMLISDGLTNNPNIPGSRIALNAGVPGQPSPDDNPNDGGQTENQNDENMKLTPEALKALGFAPDATPSETDISTAIVRLMGEKQSADAAKVTAESEATAANTKVITLTTQLSAAHGKLSETVASNAVKEGRITEADKPKWITALNTDLDGESAKLATLMPVLNTSSKLPDLGGRRDANVLDAQGNIETMNTAARAYAAEHNIDISNAEGWGRAWNGAKAAKPEVFTRATK
jgi:hypothetical protein